MLLNNFKLVDYSIGDFAAFLRDHDAINGAKKGGLTFTMWSDPKGKVVAIARRSKTRLFARVWIRVTD